MQKYHVINFGCQMNERDAQTMAGTCEGLGYVATDEPEEADLILVNTCCVRDTAQARAMGKIGQLKRLKDARPGLRIGVGGCMVEQSDVRARLEKTVHVDLVFGTKELESLPTILGGAGGMATTAMRAAVSRKSPYQALVNVSRGCSDHCSYCIVPMVRGDLRSRSPEEILDEVEGLVAKGYVEITFLGQNVTAYGQDQPDYPSLAVILRRAAQRGPKRIRLMTSHPKDFTGELIETMAQVPSICEHVHLPVQSGSDAILGAMGRRYTANDYLKLVEAIREAVPGVAISTDCIVGFPGEKEADFAQTMDLFREVKFSDAFTFIYSPRRGTPAASRTDQIAPEVKKDRIRRLIELQNTISLDVNLAEVGKTLEVLVEGRGRKDQALAVGRSRKNHTVLFPGENVAEGQLVSIMINRASPFNLEGERPAP